MALCREAENEVVPKLVKFLCLTGIKLGLNEKSLYSYL